MAPWGKAGAGQRGGEVTISPCASLRAPRLSSPFCQRSRTTEASKTPLLCRFRLQFLHSERKNCLGELPAGSHNRCLTFLFQQDSNRQMWHSACMTQVWETRRVAGQSERQRPEKEKT